MSILLYVEHEAIDIQQECSKRGLNIAPASIFTHNSRQAQNNHIRISLVAPATRQNLAIGLKRLAEIIR